MHAERWSGTWLGTLALVLALLSLAWAYEADREAARLRRELDKLEREAEGNWQRTLLFLNSQKLKIEALEKRAP